MKIKKYELKQVARGVQGRRGESDVASARVSPTRLPANMVASRFDCANVPSPDMDRRVLLDNP